MQGLIGKKIGMTRIFDKEIGSSIPVTIVHIGDNICHQIKNSERDGYDAVQLGYGEVSDSRINGPMKGHFKKHNSSPTKVIKEFCADGSEGVEPGKAFGVETLESVKFVDVTGVTKGRGFTGTVKRHNFTTGRKTHGNKNVRRPGAIGACAYPARVFPGMKMSGQFGNKKRTVKGLEVVEINKEEGLVYIKGALPGPNKGIVCLRNNKSKKTGGVKQ